MTTSKTDKDGGKVHRLQSLEVNEVSIVDAPANMRPFLIVKRDSKVSAEVFKDQDGNLTAGNVSGKEVPHQSSLSEKSIELLDSIGDGDAGSDAGPQLAGKAGSEVKGEGVATLLQEIEVLSNLEGALKPGMPSVAAAKRGLSSIEKSVSRLSDKIISLDEQVTSQSETIDKQSSVIREQADEIAKARELQRVSGKRVAASSSLQVEVTKYNEKPDEQVSWPYDLNAES